MLFFKRGIPRHNSRGRRPDRAWNFDERFVVRFVSVKNDIWNFFENFPPFSVGEIASEIVTFRENV